MSTFVISSDSSSVDVERSSILNHPRTTGVLCLIVAIAALLYWCFTERQLHGDELGLFNAVYMAYSTGDTTYPMHGQWDYMTVHPPFLYWVIGMLMRLGISPMQAAGLHCWLLLLAVLISVLSSRLEPRLRVGVPVACLMTICFYGVHTMRPEVSIFLSWLAGHVALEASRVAAWSRWRLAFAGLFLAYASGLHYWSFLACVGALPYLVIMCRNLGLRQFFPRALALVGGAAIFVVPALAFFVIPCWSAICEMVGGTRATGSLAAAYASHLSIFDYIPRYEPGHALLPSGILFQPVIDFRVIPVVTALAVLCVRGPWRLMALASAPLPLFVAFCVERKAGPSYLLPEIHLWFLALVLVIHSLFSGAAALVARQRRSPVAGFTFASAIIAVYAAALTCRTICWHQLDFLPEDRLAFFRAVSRQLLPSKHLLVFASNCRWYTSGANDACFYTLWGKNWDEFAGDMVPGSGIRFSFHDDWFANQRKAVPLPHWYLEGRLHLTGFTIGQSDFLNIVVSQDTGEPVEGFCLDGDGRTLKRFRAAENGDYVFVTMKTTAGAEILVEPVSIAGIRLENTDHSPDMLFAAIYPAALFQNYQANFEKVGQIRDIIRGTLEPVDKTALIATHRRSDSGVRLHRTLAEGLIAFGNHRAEGQPVALEPFLKRPELLPLNDNGYELRTNHSQDDWQTQNELEVLPNTRYGVTFDLGIRKGGIYVHVYDPATNRYLHSFSRTSPQPSRAEGFVFNSGEASRLLLAVGNNRPNGSPDRSEAILKSVRYTPIVLKNRED